MFKFIATVTIEGTARTAEDGKVELQSALADWARLDTNGRVSSVTVNYVTAAPEPVRQVHSIEMTTEEREAVERHLATLRG